MQKHCEFEGGFRQRRNERGEGLAEFVIIALLIVIIALTTIRLFGISVFGGSESVDLPIETSDSASEAPLESSPNAELTASEAESPLSGNEISEEKKNGD